MRKPTSRDMIMDAATAVAKRDGASRLTIDAVAREVGLSKTGLLYSFPSKEALLTALLVRVIDRMNGLSSPDAGPGGCCDTSGDAPTDRQSQLRHDLEIFRYFLREDPDLRRAILIAGAQNPDLLDPFREFLSSKLDRACRQARDPVMAMVLIAAMDGLMFQHLLNLPPAEPEVREKILQRIEEMLTQLEIRT